MSSRFERTETRQVYDGTRFTVRADAWVVHGRDVEREVVSVPASAVIVAHDGQQVWLVRQPREAVGVPDLLELPAGTVDPEDESPLHAARRELAEEVGLSAARWDRIFTCFTSPGFTDEVLHVYLATEVSRVERPEASDTSRIEIVTRSLAELDALIDEVTDAKTLLGLLALKVR
jgi:8-oxo-dGTP pyrophosphatase MutT (NUDIX family)